jgi:hypothetical protein
VNKRSTDRKIVKEDESNCGRENKSFIEKEKE